MLTLNRYRYLLNYYIEGANNINQKSPAEYKTQNTLNKKPLLQVNLH